MATIHPLGLAYLAKQKAYSDAYDAYAKALRKAFGPKARPTIRIVRRQDMGPELGTASDAMDRARYDMNQALDAMRAAGATVHPIEEGA